MPPHGAGNAPPRRRPAGGGSLLLAPAAVTGIAGRRAGDGTTAARAVARHSPPSAPTSPRPDDAHLPTPAGRTPAEQPGRHRHLAPRITRARPPDPASPAAVRSPLQQPPRRLSTRKTVGRSPARTAARTRHASRRPARPGGRRRRGPPPAGEQRWTTRKRLGRIGSSSEGVKGTEGILFIPSVPFTPFKCIVASSPVGKRGVECESSNT